MNLGGGINLMLAGSARVTVFIAAAAAMTRIGELVLRALNSVLTFVGFTESSFARIVGRYVAYARPYKDSKWTIVAKEALILTSLVIVTNTVVSLLFAPAPGIYNAFLRWISPLRIDAGYHPLAVALAARLGFALPA